MSQRKFEEIKKANQAAARKLMEEHDSNSSSEEEGDEDLEGKQGKILAKTFITYTTHTGIPLLTDLSALSGSLFLIFCSYNLNYHTG